MSEQKILADKQNIDIKKIIMLILGIIVYFSAICLSSAGTAKKVALITSICSIAVLIIRFRVVKTRLSIPFIALTLWVIANGISTIYAVSGKFAIKGFVPLLTSFGVVIFLLSFANGDKNKLGRGFASILSGTSAVIGLVSIDFISTRIISTPVLAFIGLFNSDYANIAAIEEGVRMISILQNPNVFAGCMGIGVFISLGLSVSSDNIKERTYNNICLFLNALSFLLAFSMGASGVIVIAFIVYLLLDRNSTRGYSLVLMVETLILTVIAAFAISATSFTNWTEPRPVPLVCAVVGAILLCIIDKFIGEKISHKLQKHIKIIPVIIVAMFVCLAVFAALAMNITGSISLKAGETLRRSIYPNSGAYTISIKADAPVSVIIESQNKEDTMMHTNTVIYQGLADGAEVIVPDGSIVIYANFICESDTTINEVTFTGDSSSYSFPLKYKLLPEFVANRMQGLFANQNAIQRIVFFEDGIKLFKRSPVIGLGMGAYENGIVSVQEFFYETKYAHNHYIQSLVEVGIIGLVLFVGVLAASAVAVIQTRRKSEQEANPLNAALGGALVFMAAHAAVEVTFSMYCYLPMAFGIFGIIALCCSNTLSLSKLKDNIKNGILIVLSALMIVYVALLAGNMYARYKVDTERKFSSLEFAIKIDRFEWADHMVSYVYSAMDIEQSNAQIHDKAMEYAKKIENLDSNTAQSILAEYYFTIGKQEDAFRMIEKFVMYTKADPSKWEEAFNIMLKYFDGSEQYMQEMKNIYNMLKQWNSENMGQITLSENIMNSLTSFGILQ